MLTNTLTAKARTALGSVAARETGSRTLTADEMASLEAGVRDVRYYASDMVDTMTLLVAMASVGINIDQLLADLFFAMEHDEENRPLDTVREVIERHVALLPGASA